MDDLKRALSPAIDQALDAGYTGVQVQEAVRELLEEALREYVDLVNVEIDASQP